MVTDRSDVYQIVSPIEIVTFEHYFHTSNKKIPLFNNFSGFSNFLTFFFYIFFIQLSTIF